ncbi:MULTISPECIES: hypothetical protein [Planktothricoides]|uniref:Uncharacterized protein n=1 Tax=Planktothricoides raciborskii GIHE-MW2 TaxID=2792601 RepID=A0AAU8JDW8_9CYAN|nr:hypothetical protein [Planktothricoides sp. SR001]
MPSPMGQSESDRLFYAYFAIAVAIRCRFESKVTFEAFLLRFTGLFVAIDTNGSFNFTTLSAILTQVVMMFQRCSCRARSRTSGVRMEVDVSVRMHLTCHIPGESVVLKSAST